MNGHGGREWFQLDVTLGERYRDGQVITRTIVGVKARTTACDHLAIHESVTRDWHGLWTVTHIESGYRIIDGIRSQDQASLLAGALGEVLDWAEEGKSRHGYGYMTLWKQFQLLDPKLQLWIKKWSQL